jgi:ribosomal-protein-alanine N-acetyltransferase
MKLKADIIKCGFDELKKIAEIESKCIPDGWSLKAFEDWYDDKKTVVFAAVCNGEMIGFANSSWVLDEGELLNIAVLESYRNNGIAGELFEKMERFFSEKGIKIIYLEVREKNQPALSFYEKYGFIKNGFRKNYYRNPDDNGVLMMKKIGDKYAYTGN